MNSEYTSKRYSSSEALKYETLKKEQDQLEETVGSLQSCLSRYERKTTNCRCKNLIEVHYDKTDKMKSKVKDNGKF